MPSRIFNGLPNLITINKSSLQARGLIAWWPLNHAHGNFIHNIAYGQHVITSMPGGANNPTWTGNPIFGQHLEFDGSSDYILIAPNEAWNLSNFSVSLWVKPLDTDNYHRVFEAPSSWGWQINWRDSTDTIGMVPTWNTINRKADTTLTVGEWYHVVFTHNDNTDTVGCYINGKSSNMSNGVGGFNPTGTNVSIGARESSLGQYFTGGLFDIRLYDRILTEPEAIHLYNPQTRWDLYNLPKSDVVSVIIAAAILPIMISKIHPSKNVLLRL